MTKSLKSFGICAALLMGAAAVTGNVNMAYAHNDDAACENPITKSQVIEAQEKWGDAIVAIGASETPEEAALDTLNTLYAYDIGTVLFKPTLASDVPFRGDKDSALSYFVGGDIEEDGGFALAPYTNVRFDSEGIVTDCDSAVSMGEYYFRKPDGEEIKVEYSFGYVRDEDGNLRINLHHSSMPFSN